MESLLSIINIAQFQAHVKLTFHFLRGLSHFLGAAVISGDNPS